MEHRITISDARSPGFHMSHRSICRMYQIGDFYVVRLLLLTVLAIAVDARISFGQSETPEFAGDQLSFSGVDSAAWQSLPPVIAELEKSGDETYYVVVQLCSQGEMPAARWCRSTCESCNRQSIPYPHQLVSTMPQGRCP